MRGVGPKRSGSAFPAWFGGLALAALAATAGALWPTPATVAQTAPNADAAAPCGPPTTAAAPCATPPAAGPAAWGVLNLNATGTGLRAAPNGAIFQPLLSFGSDINLGLLPDKRLYLFLNNGFVVQRSAARGQGVGLRDFDAVY